MTTVVDPVTPGPCRTRAYQRGRVAAHDFPVADVSEHLEQPGTVVWIDFCRPTREQLSELAQELGLHELAIEDAVGPHQRPKLDHYQTHKFLVAHAVQVDVERGALDTTEIDAFIGTQWIVTVRKDEAFTIDPVLQRWDRSEELAESGVPYLLYGLLDVIVDDYFDAVEAFDTYYDEVSERIFADQPLQGDEQRRWFSLRRALVQLHRLVVPTREVVSSLLRREHGDIPEKLYPYFQDVYDHVLRISESTDSLRELVSTIVETNLSVRDYRQNLVVKKVSSYAAILAVPALVTGYYGMNVDFPGIGTTWGFVVSTAVMVGLVVLLWRYFRRNDWL